MKIPGTTMAFLVVFACAGCQRGNPGGELAGQVTIDGEPVRGGNVIIANDDGTIIQIGRIGDDGRYSVAEPPLGDVKIAVQTSQFKGFKGTTASNGAEDTQGRGSGGMIVPDPKTLGMTYVWVPEQYEDYNTSGLTLKIKRGKLEHDIKLTGKKQ